MAHGVVWALGGLCEVSLNYIESLKPPRIIWDPTSKSNKIKDKSKPNQTKTQKYVTAIFPILGS